MTLRFDWQIPMGQYINGRTVKPISELKYTNGYKIVCVWSNYTRNIYAPKSIQVHQDKVGGDTVFSGELALLLYGREILRKKFLQLIDSESTFIKIQLKDAKLLQILLATYCSSSLSPGTNVSTIPANFSLKGYVKIENNPMRSLLELSQDFKKLLNPETSCFPTDVSLKCDGGSIQAHKIVLAARSPVFNSMFTHQMLENRQNEVDITDVDETTMRALVNYIYAGSVATIPGETLTRSLGDLLIAADKYQILSLKTYCCDLLKRNLTFQNVLWILELGDTIAGELKSSAIEFICHCPEFSTVQQQNNEAWKSLERDKPDLAMEVLKAVVKSKDEKIKRIRRA